MPLPSPARRRAVSLLVIFPWILLLFQFALMLPRYNKLFHEHNLKLSPLTTIVLDVSTWVQKYLLLAFLIVFACMGISIGIAHAIQSREMSGGRRLLVLLLVFGLPCGLFAVSWLGVWNTHRTLIEGLQR